MNYFSKIKPVLNKLSELNVYDSLEVVRAYIQASADGNTNRTYVKLNTLVKNDDMLQNKG